MSDLVLVEVADGVATITLNRPEARNALSRALLRALPAAIGEADADPDVRAIVLTGADPVFCAGLDLREVGSGSLDLGAEGAAGGDDAATVARRGPFPPRSTPLIGAINGAAVTGGLELVLACDFLVNHVVPHEELVPTAQQLARDVASNDAGAVQRLMRTYSEGSEMTAGEAWALEARVAADWQRQAFDPEEVARRREAITERGRTQQA